MLPWINTTAVDQRRALVAAWIAGDAPIAELARRFRVSRKTAHKFINRFNKLGDAGLHDLPRAPRNPRATDPNLAAMIVDAKRNAPLLGPKKIIPTLRGAHPDLPWPTPSTAGAILDREGLVKRRKRSRRSPPFADPFANVQAPNDCWAIDFKGWARTSDSARLDPLTLIDADSRFLIACEGLPRPTLACVLPVVDKGAALVYGGGIDPGQHWSSSMCWDASSPRRYPCIRVSVTYVPGLYLRAAPSRRPSS